MYKPKICSIELFRKCNLRCRMCHMWKAEESGNGLNKATLERLAGELQDVLTGEKEVVFSGGEPLLFKGIVDLVRIYSERGFKVGIASNGTLIDKHKAKQLAEAGLKNIQLSFDSINKETHDFLRGVNGAHEKVLKAAGYLSSYNSRISVCAQTVISGKNLNELIDTIEFIKHDKRFDFISFMSVTTPFFSSADDNWRNEDEFSFLWPKEKEGVGRVIDKMIEMKKDSYPIANPVSHLELFRSYFHNPYIRRPDVRCRLGDYVLSIDPAGDIRPCCFMEPVGNIKEGNLADILSSEEVDRLRQVMRSCGKTCNTLVNCFFQE